MSNRRHLARSLFPLHSKLDHQRAVQRSIKFSENSIRKSWFVRKRVRISFQENESVRLENQRVNEIVQVFLHQLSISSNSQCCTLCIGPGHKTSVGCKTLGRIKTR